MTSVPAGSVRGIHDVALKVAGRAATQFVEQADLIPRGSFRMSGLAQAAEPLADVDSYGSVLRFMQKGGETLHGVQVLRNFGGLRLLPRAVTDGATEHTKRLTQLFDDLRDDVVRDYDRELRPTMGYFRELGQAATAAARQGP